MTLRSWSKNKRLQQSRNVAERFIGFVLRRGRILRKKKIMEEKKGVSTPNLFSLFPFPFFLLLMVVFTFPLMF